MQKILMTNEFDVVLYNNAQLDKKALFVHSKSFEMRKEYEKIAIIPHVSFIEFEPNPNYDSIICGAEKYIKNNCSYIISIGGGSSIDVAKGIKYLLKDKTIVHIAIPTTSGTGSESTQFAVVYKNDIKQSLDCSYLLPEIAILDGSLVKTVSNFQKRCTLLDALCQCIESHWSLKSTSESRSYSIKGIKLIVDNYEEYLSGKINALNMIILASNYSGRAINITKTTAPHAISYILTKTYNIPHGCAVACTIIQFWEHLLLNYMNTTHPSGPKFIFERINELFDSFGAGNDNNMDVIKQLFKMIMPPINMEWDIDLIVKNINLERLLNYPLNLSNNEIKQILLMSSKDK